MTKELLKEIATLNELDKKRTQGVLDVSDNYIFIRPECRGGYQRYNLRMEFDNEFKDASNDTEFYSQAPRMLEIINELQAALDAKSEWKCASTAPYDTMCLFYTVQGHIVEGFIYDGDHTDFGYTHWQPLPQPPKEDL